MSASLATNAPPKLQDDAKKKTLAGFRKDLEIYPGPEEADGCPTYSVFDPVSSQYYKISYFEYILMTKLKHGMTLDELITIVSRETLLEADQQSIVMFLEQAEACHLLASPFSAERVKREWEKQQMSLASKVLLYYLYFKIPLVKPDQFLAKTLPFAKQLTSRIAMLIYTLMIALGLVLVLERLPEFLHTFTHFFNFEGAVAYSSAIIVLKLFHEFGHAYTAKYYGVRVPSMGVIFLVLWPVLYSDVTDAWRLRSRKHRLHISLAGVAVELVISGICLLGWALTGEGILHSIFFVISSAVWISTLLVNINPAMRFDGYYIACDILKMDNLQMRANQLAVWAWRKLFLGIDLGCPENGLSQGKFRVVMALALYSWIYRFFLYLGIAFFVYAKFAKALGIFLFFVEIGVFILLPVYREVRQLMQLRQFFKFNKRLALTLTCLSLFLIWAVLPLAHNLKTPAIIHPVKEQTIYAPYAGIIKEIYVEREQTVQTGQSLIRIYSDKLAQDIAFNQVEKQIISHQIDRLSSDEVQPEEQAMLAQKKAELGSTIAYGKGLLKNQKQSLIVAEGNGSVYEWDQNLKVGQAVKRAQEIGRIANLELLEVITFVPEKYLDLIKEDDEAYFIPQGSVEQLKAKVKAISPTRVETLYYPQLASTHGGELAVTPEADRSLKVVNSYYSVTLEFDSTQNLLLGKTGAVVFPQKRYSMVADLYRDLHALFWKEATL
ncbi:MAG: peptidase [Chlamydiales bacterium]|jgi:putative peptide zinc metalloprotease protein|nr:peptidase [Chlamydiales bacterium]